MTLIPDSRNLALKLDQRDPLASRRDLFELPAGCCYLVGHSLGPPPRTALERLENASAAWKQDMVRSWNTAGWIDLAGQTGARIAPLIGARAEEVTVADNVSVNLFKLAAAALDLSARRVICVEADEFPTDQYIAQALADRSGAEFRRLPPGMAGEALEQGGVLVRSLVNYRSGEVADMAGFEEQAMRHGSMIVWDLSHASGVLETGLNRAAARLATGCTYKYLNGGPGAPAFIYVARDLASQLESPLPGWMGHAAPFDFSQGYIPTRAAGRFASGTPPILSMASLAGALEAFDGVDMAVPAAKARALGDLVIRRAMEMGIEVLSPVRAPSRGGHVSLRIAHGYPVVQALAARGILADFRTPDTVRFGLSPLFLTYTGVWDALDALSEILAGRLWDEARFHERAKVT